MAQAITTTSAMLILGIRKASICSGRARIEIPTGTNTEAHYQFELVFILQRYHNVYSTTLFYNIGPLVSMVHISLIGPCPFDCRYLNRTDAADAMYNVENHTIGRYPHAAHTFAFPVFHVPKRNSTESTMAASSPFVHLGS